MYREREREREREGGEKPNTRFEYISLSLLRPLLMVFEICYYAEQKKHIFHRIKNEKKNKEYFFLVFSFHPYIYIYTHAQT